MNESSTLVTSSCKLVVMRHNFFARGAPFFISFLWKSSHQNCFFFFPNTRKVVGVGVFYDRIVIKIQQ